MKKCTNKFNCQNKVAFLISFVLTPNPVTKNIVCLNGAMTTMREEQIKMDILRHLTQTAIQLDVIGVANGPSLFPIVGTLDPNINTKMRPSKK